MMVPFDQRLAEALVDRGRLTPEQLEHAGEAAEERGLRLSEALLHLRLVAQDDLSELIAEELGLVFVPTIDVETIDVELSMELGVSFARSQQILPLWWKDGRVQVGVTNPLDLGPLDAVRLMLPGPAEPVVVPEQTLVDAINKVFDRRAAAGQVMDDIADEQVVSSDTNIDEIDIDIIDTDDEAPIIRLVNAILNQAIKERASDIHIEPFERHIAVRFRVDGVLYEIIQPPRRFHASISSRIKVMAGLDIAEKRIPQDGRIKIKVAGKDIDIRLSTVPTSHGERIVMRLLDKTAVLKDLSHIGMGATVLDHVNDLITRSYGIILVTGPTGSGKTTTLYASLAKINSPTRNIITVEDPVEYQLNGIGQIQVNNKVGLTFAAGLRSILRQDPDVVMIGEIRDGETAEIAIQASLTGHLVFSTLHTNDAAGAVSRLVDMGVEPFLVSSSVIGMMAQRLVRTLCLHCKEPVVPNEVELEKLGYTRERFMEATPGHVYQPVGCQECLDTGFMGRTGIYELLVVDDAVRKLIMEGVDSNSIKKHAIRHGMLTLRDDGARKVMLGQTAISEVLRVTQDDLLDLES
ncbi:MAG: type II secretion system ATPase GspE [Myxococcales bacterium]|nr:type II secretion system ATPase GspE [Myxococcales bacterium]